MKEIKFAAPMIGREEKEAVAKVLDGPILVHGPVADLFENDFAKFVNSENAVSVSSCTAGMHLFYFAMGLKEGDEVIVPAQTHVATAHAVELTGAKAVFVDVDEYTGNISTKAVENAVTSKTKAIAVVHYLGVPVKIKEIMKIAKKYNLLVVEDCALSLGAKVDGIHTGLFGDIGVFSFYPVKHITTGEGGIVITKSKEIAEKLRFLKAFGVDKTHSTRTTPGLYDAPALGFNYRMSEIHAAIGVEQIKKIPEFLSRRKNNFELLSKLLGDETGFKLMPQIRNDQCYSSYYCAAALLDEKNSDKRYEVINKMKDLGVGTSIYYPHPVPRMTYYRNKYGYNKNDYKNAAMFSDQMIALPVGPHLSEEQIVRLGEIFLQTVDDLNE